MTVGPFPDEADGSSEDELSDTTMPDRTDRESEAPGRSKDVATQDDKASTMPGSSVKRMADGSDAQFNKGKSMQTSQVRPMARTVGAKSVHSSQISWNARNNGGKPVNSSQVPPDSQNPQPKGQHSSSGWLRSGVSLFRNLVDQQVDTTGPRHMHSEAPLAELKSKIETLEQQLHKRDSLLLKQGKAHDQYRKDVEAEVSAKLRQLDDGHKVKHRELRNECEDALRCLKTGHQQELADRQHQSNRQLGSAKLELSRTVEASNRDAASAREEIDRFRKICRDFEEKLKMQDSTISRMQSARFKTIEASHWAPLESSEIEGKLSSIQTRVRKWSSDHALSTLDQIRDPEGYSHSLNELTKRGCVLEPEGLRERILLNKSMRKPGKAAAVLLGAAIMHDIMHNIITNPFFAFLGRPGEALLGAEQASALGMLVEHIGTYDQAGAEGLRCQVLRLLDPPTKDDSDNVAGNAKVMARKSRGRAVAKLTLNIIDGFLGLLTEEKQRKAFDGLAAIVEEAAMLSWSFWTRRTVVCALSWPQLQTRAHGTLSYDSTSDLFEPHSMHNMLLEDEPQALDGKDIMLFCSPALSMSGNAEGEDYHRYKILKKAVVWMG